MLLFGFSALLVLASYIYTLVLTLLHRTGVSWLGHMPSSCFFPLCLLKRGLSLPELY